MVRHFDVLTARRRRGGVVIASGVIGRRPSPDAVLKQLEQTAQTLGGTKPNQSYGYGLLEAGAATSKPATAARSR